MRTIAYIAVAAFAVMCMDTAQGRTAAFLKAVEGFRATPYSDAAGNRAIGYGFTAADWIGKGRITEREASAELTRICRNLSVMLKMELGGSQRLTADEETAVVSFIYNVGWYNFKQSTMCRMLKEGKRGQEVAAEFSKWVYVTKRGGGKVVCDGLRIRRARERRRFLGC